MHVNASAKTVRCQKRRQVDATVQTMIKNAKIKMNLVNGIIARLNARENIHAEKRHTALVG